MMESHIFDRVGCALPKKEICMLWNKRGHFEKVFQCDLLKVDTPERIPNEIGMVALTFHDV